MNEWAHLLRGIRHDLGMGQSEMGLLLGVHYNTVRNYETGAKAIPIHMIEIALHAIGKKLVIKMKKT